jgi:hypothetical protein
MNIRTFIVIATFALSGFCLVAAFILSLRGAPSYERFIQTGLALAGVGVISLAPRAKIASAVEAVGEAFGAK